MEVNTELERLTNIDGLTGLSNRRFFDRFVVAQWKLASRAKSPISVLMIDVDDFKKYNDHYGHLAGDEVLKSVALALKSSFMRPTDLCARFGGEEFVAVLPSTPADRLRPLGEPDQEPRGAVSPARSLHGGRARHDQHRRRVGDPERYGFVQRSPGGRGRRALRGQAIREESDRDPRGGARRTIER